MATTTNAVPNGRGGKRRAAIAGIWRKLDEVHQGMKYATLLTLTGRQRPWKSAPPLSLSLFMTSAVWSWCVFQEVLDGYCSSSVDNAIKGEFAVTDYASQDSENLVFSFG